MAPPSVRANVYQQPVELTLICSHLISRLSKQFWRWMQCVSANSYMYKECRIHRNYHLLAISNAFYLIIIFSLISPDHPGFHFSPDGGKKDSPHTKEGPTPRRGRRKGKKLKRSTVS